MKTVGLIMLILGALLTGVGMMFKILHWPDMFKGIYSGPAIGIVGVILFFIQSAKKQ